MELHLVRVCFLFADSDIPVSSYDREGKKALWCLFYEGTNLSHEGSTLRTYSPPEVTIS